MVSFSWASMVALVVKTNKKSQNQNPPANAGDGFNPWVGKIP